MTWNCKHLANAVIRVAIERVCLSAGYEPTIICTPEEAKDKKILEKLKKILDDNLEKIIPNYKANLNWAIYPAIWHLDGVAKSIQNKKPEIKSPIKNLYLIGDCVKAPGIGVNCAINSAKILADMI